MDMTLLFIYLFIFSFYSFIFTIPPFIQKISILYYINHDNLIWHSEANEQLKKRGVFGGMFKNKYHLEPRFCGLTFVIPALVKLKWEAWMTA